MAKKLRRAPMHFLKGLALPFRAVGYLLASGKIFAFAALPFVICLVLYVAFFATGTVFVDEAAAHIIEPGAWWQTALYWALTIALWLGMFLLLAFSYTFLCLVVAAPLYDFLSAAVEEELTGDVTEEPFTIWNFVTDIWRALWFAALLLLIGLAVFIFGLLVVPVTSVIAFCISAVLLTLEYMEYPMERRRLPVRQRFAFARDHFWELLGLGLPLLLAAGIPFVGAVFLPLGVIGGTVLFVEAEEGND